jgi:putative CocE/NonD family hydrolase
MKFLPTHIFKPFGLVILFVLVCGVLLLGGGQCFAKSSEVKVLRDVMVPMRDGVRLAMDIHLPATDGKVTTGAFPTILIRTPYGKDKADTHFARRGYATVVQDVRGRYKSEGDFYIYMNESSDGLDTIEWVARQPWCNGKIGTYGTSYKAAAELALAVHRPPQLKTMFIGVCFSDYIEEGAGRGGAFGLLHNLAYVLRLASTGKEAQNDAAAAAALAEAYADENLAQWLYAAPLKANSPLQWAPSYQRWYNDWRVHPPNDDYWRQVGYNFEEYYSQYPDIPVYIVSGWYDLFKGGSIRNFQGLWRKNANTKLLMGPWTHGYNHTRKYAGDVNFGPNAQLVESMETEVDRWFDQFLKGENTGILREPPVRYFLIRPPEKTVKTSEGRLQSGGVWKTSETWPPKGFENQKFYLHSDGALQRAICKTKAPSRFQYDPRNPVPSIGGDIVTGRQIVPRGPRNQVPGVDTFAARNQLPLSSRRDVLSFETAVLERDIEVTGAVSVSLWVSSDARDTDFTAKLIDVYPPSKGYPGGYAMNLEDGILRMRYRNRRGPERLLKPGKIYHITIDLLNISNVFRKGHKIRLDISSSNFPVYDVNPNTGEAIGQHTHMVTAINTVYHSGRHRSCLILPVRSAVKDD